MPDGPAKKMMHERQPDRIVSGAPHDEDARLDAMLDLYSTLDQSAPGTRWPLLLGLKRKFWNGSTLRL